MAFTPPTNALYPGQVFDPITGQPIPQPVAPPPPPPPPVDLSEGDAIWAEPTSYPTPSFGPSLPPPPPAPRPRPVGRGALWDMDVPSPTTPRYNIPSPTPFVPPPPRARQGYPVEFDDPYSAVGPPPAPRPMSRPPGPAAPLPPPPPGPLDHSSRDAFLRSLLPYAQMAQAKTGVPVEIMMAMPLNEAGWQKPALGNNLFGIKGSNPKTGANTGPVNTWEDYGKGRVNIQDTFRAYDSPAESFEDFFQFLLDNPRYKTARQVLESTGDGEAFIRAVHKAGYATDPQWSDKIIAISRDAKRVAGEQPPTTPGGRILPPDPQGNPLAPIGEAIDRGIQGAIGGGLNVLGGVLSATEPERVTKPSMRETGRYLDTGEPVLEPTGGTSIGLGFSPFEKFTGLDKPGVRKMAGVISDAYTTNPMQIGGVRAGKLIGQGMKAAGEGLYEAGTRMKGAEEAWAMTMTPGGTAPSGSALKKTLDMLEDAKAQPGFGDRIRAAIDSLPDKYRAFQEQVTDRFAGINALGKKNGVRVNPLDDPEIQVARLGGIGEAQIQRATDIAMNVKNSLGTPWKGAADHLDAWLHLRHTADIANVKGASRLSPGGFAAGEAADALVELEQMMGPQRWNQLQHAGLAAVSESQATLNKMVDEGLVSRELADVLLDQYPHYNRQNIIRETEDIANGLGGQKINVNSANIQRLTDLGTEKARTSPYSSIMGSAAQAEALIFRNRAARTAATRAIEEGIGKPVTGPKPPGDVQGTISYMENGERQLVEVPAWFEKEAKAFAAGQDNSFLAFTEAVNSIPRQAFVTYNPTWPAANLVLDYMNVALTRGVTPMEELRGLAGALRDLLSQDPVLAQMRRSGAGQAGWFTKDAKDLARIVNQSGNLAIENEAEFLKLLKNPAALLKATVTAPFKFVKGVGTVAEQGTRRAVFTNSLKKMGVQDVSMATESQLAQAAVDARRGTIDFRRGGEFSKAANAVSIFLNAGIQGTMLPFRALRDSSRTRWALGAAMAANTAVYAYNRQFPEYKDVPRDVRRGSLVLMLPSEDYDEQGRKEPRYLTIIPKLREWGLFFGTQTYIYERLDEMANEDMGTFLAGQTARLTPIDASSLGVTQPGVVLQEQMSNYDTYRQKPIVPPEQEGLPATEQYDRYTSETIKRMAQATGISPLRLQHISSGLLGGTGRALTSVSDALLQQLAPRPVDYRIAELAHELDGIKPPFVHPNDVPLARTEYLNSLSATDREAVLELNRQPEQKTPILGPMVDRFYGERGGEQFRLGREAADQVTGMSSEQTTAAAKALSSVFDNNRQRQEDLDKALAARPNDPEAGMAWEKARSEMWTEYRGSLFALGIVFPNAAQLGDKNVWKQYQEQVYTIAGQIPDRRTKGQILASAYRAIPMENIDPLTKDFDTFFHLREEFKAALSPEDQALLESTLSASLTPTEKAHAKDMEALTPYYEVKNLIGQSMPAFAEAEAAVEAAGGIQAVEAQLRMTTFNDPNAVRLRPLLSVYRAGTKAADAARERLRRSNKELEAAGEKWRGWQPLKPPSSSSPFPGLPGLGGLPGISGFR